MDDIFIYFIKLPHGISEMVTPCEGGYTVYIEESLTDEQRLEAYNHALRHIQNGDFDMDNVKTVAEMEIAAHGKEPIPAHKFEKELAAMREKHRKATKRLENYYKRREKRQKKLLEQGWEEVTIIEDGEYGEPVVKTIQRRKEW